MGNSVESRLDHNVFKSNVRMGQMDYYTTSYTVTLP